MNADDWGLDRPTTDLIVRCFDARRITSASGMVYMRDSDRAAALAREKSLPVGLHLNLTEPYSDPAAPPEESHRQERIVRRFRRLGLRLLHWLYDPTIRNDVERCIRDQLDRFAALYGRPPTHVDGHKGVEVCPNVLFARALPKGARIRKTLDFHPPPGPLVSAARALRHRVIRARFLSTEYLYDLEDWRHALAHADGATVEVTVHPALGDVDLLMSDQWRSSISRCRLGSWADLAP